MKTQTKRKVEDTRQLVAAAAMKLIAESGGAPLSMAEIAKAAGVSRQAFYRAFETRSSLFKYILNIRLQKIGAAVKRHFLAATSLEEALLECTLRAVEEGRKDKVYQIITTRYSDRDVEQFVFMGSAEILQVTKSLWGPLLRDARDRGQLDPDISDERYLDWIQQVEAMLSIRQDLDRAQQQEVLRDFLVPSIIRQKRLKKTAL